MSGLVILAGKYKYSTYVVLRHPVIARHAFFSVLGPVCLRVDISSILEQYILRLNTRDPVLLFL